jgi:uncharacterized coiled-coil protein SlyX
MEHFSTNTPLDERIEILEAKKSEQETELSTDVKAVTEKLKPKNMVRATVSNVVANRDIQKKIMLAAGAIIALMIIKRLVRKNAGKAGQSVAGSLAKAIIVNTISGVVTKKLASRSNNKLYE